MTLCRILSTYKGSLVQLKIWTTRLHLHVILYWEGSQPHFLDELKIEEWCTIVLLIFLNNTPRI